MENLRADLDRIHTALGPKKKVDIYEVARVDPTMTIEEIMKNLVELKEEGHFKVSSSEFPHFAVVPTLHLDHMLIFIYNIPSIHTQHIGVSEIHPTALRKAHAVHPIAAAEIEISVFNLQPEALEVVKVAEELGIAVVAYS
jgi:pyridoxine 4-dehydrogenase